MKRCKRPPCPLTFSRLLITCTMIPIAACHGDDAKAPAVSRPNILFIFSDDHAYQAVSAYGSGLNHTPNIDRLADEGMLFERCVVTNSICGPSRATILTGKYSHMNGFYRNINQHNQFDGSQQTFPKIMQEHGYQTAIFGKWHLGSEPTGFDDWEVMIVQGFYYNPDFLSANGHDTVVGYSVDVVTSKGIGWMGKNADKGPFMLMVQYKAPHREWEPGPKYMNLYDDYLFPEPPTLFDTYEGRATGARDQKMTIAHHMKLDGDNKLYTEESKMNRLGRSYSRMTDEQRTLWDKAYHVKNEAFHALGLTGDDLTRWKYQRYMQDYMSVIASVDENIGRLLDYLEASGMQDNTVVIYCSDQGFYLGEHGWFDKRWMYEESFRTPFLVRWPGVIEPGSVNNDIVSNLDFAQTFLDMAGIPLPNDMQGASLVPLFRGNTPDDWRNSFYYHYYEGGGHGVPVHEGVYADSLKLISYYELDEWEMFDLRRDPHEMRSVYGNPEYRDIQQTLLQELESLKMQLQVPEQKSTP
jgi:arylsulfatase A-like enzyme